MNLGTFDCVNLIGLLSNRWAAFKLSSFHRDISGCQGQIVRTCLYCNWNPILLGLFDQRNRISTRKVNDVTRNSSFPNINLIE